MNQVPDKAMPMSEKDFVDSIMFVHELDESNRAHRFLLKETYRGVTTSLYKRITELESQLNDLTYIHITLVQGKIEAVERIRMLEDALRQVLEFAYVHSDTRGYEVGISYSSFENAKEALSTPAESDAR